MPYHDTVMSPSRFNYDSVASGHYEKIIWDAHPVRQFWHQVRFVDMENLIDSNENSVLLDHGCASGSFLGHFRRPYAQAVGVDIAKPQVELANKKYGTPKLHFLTTDEFSKGKDASFDYVISTEVIEHIPAAEAEELMRQFHRWLKPGGRLILSTPNYCSLWPLIELFVNRFSGVDYDHQHVYKLDSKKCAQLLEKCGFKVEKYMTTFILAPFLAGISWKWAERLYRLEQKLIPRGGSLILLSASKRG